MKRLEARTTVATPPPGVYDHLVDFPRYGEHSRYLENVERVEETAEGPRYGIRVGWWKLTQTLHSTVTERTRPERIAWRVDGPLDAEGVWELSPLEDGPAADTDGPGTDLTAALQYDPDSATRLVDVPEFVPVDSIVARAERSLVAELERIVEKIVRDLHGPGRAVDVRVEPPSAPDV